MERDGEGWRGRGREGMDGEGWRGIEEKKSTEN
jgi:hypothetical protein